MLATLTVASGGCEELRILDHSFRRIGTVRPECEASGKVKTFYPHLEYSKAATATLHKYGAGPFCRFAVSKDLALEGVYLLAVRSEIRYVGKCDNLAVRFNTGYGQIAPRNCYKGGQNTNCKVNALILAEIEQGRELDLWFYETSEPLKVEKQLITALGPPWNGKM